VPKKRALSTVTQEELTMIENRLNHRPRKRLGFKTPYEVFHASLKRVAVRSLIHQESDGTILKIKINNEDIHFSLQVCLLNTHIDYIAISFKQCMSLGFMKVNLNHFLTHLPNSDFWRPAQFCFSF
jgi:hypothetical protein